MTRFIIIESESGGKIAINIKKISCIKPHFLGAMIIMGGRSYFTKQDFDSIIEEIRVPNWTRKKPVPPHKMIVRS